MDPIDTLMRSRHMETEAQLNAFDASMARLPTSLDQETIRRLLRVFEDETDHPEVMFGLLHRIEDEPHDRVARALLDELPRVGRDSRWWAEVMVIRFLNNEDARQILLDAATSSDPRQRRALLSILASIEAKPQEVSQSARDFARRLKRDVLGA